MVNTNIDEKLALNIIKQSQPLSIWEISKRMQISYSSTYRLVKKMERKGLITIEKKYTRRETNLVKIK